MRVGALAGSVFIFFRSCSLPREILDITVPIGTSSTSAISL